jgi:peptide-methionine (S)-S-oxide reductase
VSGIKAILRKNRRAAPSFPVASGCAERYNYAMRKAVAIVISIVVLGVMTMALADEKGKNPAASSRKLEKATFAGGCFWCMEPPYDKIKGVVSTTPGYTGGSKENPTYEEVSSGRTGHAESVEILYDPSQVSYSQLLDVFWHNIDPTTKDRQFVDTGSQYRTAIFYHSEEQKRLAEESKARLEKSGKFGKPIVTEIVPAGKFYPAEEYHQDYYKKNPGRYKFYRFNSGRDQYLKRIWGESTEK